MIEFHPKAQSSSVSALLAFRDLQRLGVDEVPKGWVLTTVGKACDIRNEHRLPISVGERANMAGQFPYYGPTGVLDYINEYRAEGDFALLGEDGDHFLDPINKPQTVRISGRFNVNNHAHLISGTECCDVDWFACFFRHRDISHSLTRQGANRFKLTKAGLEKLPILLPPLPEQRSIAEILRTWDEAIEKLEALRAAKEARLKALTYSMVFGTNQFRTFNDSGEPAEHRWFDLPQDWRCNSIGSISEEVSIRNGDDEHEVLSCTKYDGFVRSLEYFKKQVFSSDLSGYKVIRRGDFGFPSNHVEEGSIGLQNLVDIGLVSPIYTVFRFDAEQVDNDYAYAVLKTSLYRHIFEVSTSASVDRRGSLRWKEFSKIPFPVPPIEEQRAIVSALKTARTDLDTTKREITALQRQKRGLMQKLLTGEWRVKVGKDTEATK